MEGPSIVKLKLLPLGGSVKAVCSEVARARREENLLGRREAFSKMEIKGEYEVGKVGV